ncbi:proteasome subunit beta type-6-like [Miscanthus floridulus]|uniref:proteasome subunit beta type-6-like n=1 Tax=Miscanthus floridulus TaxID=154761 RepID=UPI003459BA9F
MISNAGSPFDTFRVFFTQEYDTQVISDYVRYFLHQHTIQLGQPATVKVGTILKQSFAIGGSGSSYLYVLLDHEWKEGMSQEEAEKFVVKVVSLAMARDGASGGVVRTVTINADGMKRNFYPSDKLPLWHDELEPHNTLLDILAAGNPDPMVLLLLYETLLGTLCLILFV